MEEIVPEREVRDYGTFGTEFYNIVYDNSVWSEEHSSPEFLATFESQREDFIDAIDTSAPPEDLDALNQFFIDVVPLYENMLYTGSLRKAAVVMDDIRQDPHAIEALTWLNESPTLLADPAKANPIGRALGYDDIAGITDEILTLLLKDGASKSNATNRMLKELSIAAMDMEIDTNPDRFVRRVVDTLLEPNDIYGPQMSYMPQLVARLDESGRPKVRAEMAAVAGSYDEMGFRAIAPGQTIAPFEMTGTPAGFALVNGQVMYGDQPVFETMDLQKTPLAYLVREGDALLINDTLDEGLRAFQTILGESKSYTDEYGTYTGYADDSPVMQLLAALMTTLDHDSVGPNFEAIEQVLEKHQDVVARLVRDVDDILDIWDETPSNFSGDNNLIDRLLPELLKIAQEPGLLEDLFMALDDPRAAKIAPFLSELAQREKDFIDVDWEGAYNKCFLACDDQFDVGTFERMDCIRACPRDEILGTLKADHNAPESMENRSLFQRTTHLMWETSETPYDVHAELFMVGESDYSLVAQALGTMISFDNLAEAYLQTITGDLHLAEHLSSTFIKLAQYIGDDGTTVAQLLTLLTDNLFGIKLSVNPTTAEVTRLFNMAIISSQGDNYRLDLNTADCRSGFKCRESNADVLYAIEAVGLVDALYPLIDVFNKHGKTDILARVVAIIFEYYPTGAVEYKDATGKPLDLTPSDFRSLEPVLIRALDETDIVADFGAFGDALLDVELEDGSKLAARFEKFVAYILTPDGNLRNLRGADFTRDPKGNIIQPLSPAYLYVDAIREMDDILDANPKTKDQLTHFLDGVSEITIETVKDADGNVSFEKPAGIQIAADGVSLLRTLWQEKTDDGTRTTWIQNKAIPKIQELASSRLLHAYFELFNEMDSRPLGLEKFRKFVLHLMESGSEVPTHLTGGGYLLGDMLLNDIHLTSLAHVMASPIDPDRVWTVEGFSELSLVMTLLTCVDAFNECDPTHVVNRVVYRLFETDTRPRANVMRILDIGASLFRETPGSKERRTARDQQIYMDFVYDLFTDDDRGIERIYGVVDYTIWGNDRRPKDWKPEDASWQISFGSEE